MKSSQWLIVVGIGLFPALTSCGGGYKADKESSRGDNTVAQCDQGEERFCGETKGICEQGVQRCKDDAWGPCEDIDAEHPYVTEQDEVCDRLDNDCDGDVDEGCLCAAGEMLDCGETMGICEPGVQRCNNGRWERCTDIDAEHKYVTGTEEICDGLDNNCNGHVDEDCECRHMATRFCDGGLGACKSGEQTCTAGFWGPCVPVQAAMVERCDGVDNDCDGEVDNGFNLTLACDSRGKCPQTRVCSDDGASSLCIDDERQFTDEQCDDIDNDCDGRVDRVAAGGSLSSVCECERRTLTIGTAENASIEGNLNLCAATQCLGDRPRGLSIDAFCYSVCQTNSDPDGDGWGYENGATCLMEASPRARTASPCGATPLGMAMTYCLNCNVEDENALPYAMCQSVPRFDLKAFGRGDVWLRVDYTYNAAGPAQSPINLWFHTGREDRKHFPLVRIGDLPTRDQAIFPIEQACFTTSRAFGDQCLGRGETCDHCGMGEVCGAVEECGDYDLSQAWLQVAAEFCPQGSGQQSGTVTLHSVELVEPNCE